MKRLKKTLAVLLVLIMALSMTPFVNAAVFDDDDDVNYNEAVDVLAGIGVVDGFPDGNFNPQGGVTRAQAAAIIARMMLGRKLADSLPDAPTGFPDCDGVSGVGFAIKYIRYCVSAGIVVGYPNGNFGPNDPVKASEFAVMLMRALKIGDTGKYVGSGWETFAIIDAMDKKLFKDVADNVDFTKPANREETAQYAFNGLLHSPEGKSTEKVWGDKGWPDGKGWEIVDLGNGEKTAIYKPNMGWIDVDVVAEDSLAASRYPTLKKLNDYADGAHDDFGRPSMKWIYTDDEVTIHSNIATPVAKFVTKVSQGDLNKATGLGAKEAEPVDAYVNQPGGQKAATITSLKNESKSSSDAVYNGTGRGIITEIYKVRIGNDDVHIAVIIKPDFAQIEKVDSKAATATKGAHTIYTINSNNVGTIFSSVVDEDDDKDSAVIKGTVAKDNWVLYYKSADKLYIEEVDTLSGKLTSKVGDGGVHTIDGASYWQAAAFKGGTVGPGGDTKPDDKDQSFYVDSFDNLLGVKEAAAAAVQIALVLKVNTSSKLVNDQIETVYNADIVNLDGVVEKISVADSVWGTDKGEQYVGKVWVYDDTDDGFVFKNTFGDHLVETRVDSISNGSATLGFASGITPAATVTSVSNATKFVVVHFNDKTPPEWDGKEVTLYTGRGQVPTYDTLTKTTAVSISTEKGASANAIADIVYIFDNKSSTVSDEFVFLTGKITQTVNGYVHEVFVKGETDTITTKSDTISDLLKDNSPSLVEFVNVGAALPADQVGPRVGSGTMSGYGRILGSVQNSSGILLVGAGSSANINLAEIASDLPVYTITVDGDDVELDSGTAADITSKVDIVTGEDEAFALFEKGSTTKIAAIYILIGINK